jgi:hypothetical protein
MFLDFLPALSYAQAVARLLSVALLLACACSVPMLRTTDIEPGPVLEAGAGIFGYGNQVSVRSWRFSGPMPQAAVRFGWAGNSALATDFTLSYQQWPGYPSVDFALGARYRPVDCLNLCLYTEESIGRASLGLGLGLPLQGPEIVTLNLSGAYGSAPDLETFSGAPDHPFSEALASLGYSVWLGRCRITPAMTFVLRHYWPVECTGYGESSGYNRPIGMLGVSVAPWSGSREPANLLPYGP